MLKYVGASTLIITGMATEICVLLTANDAYMRDYKLIVPSDCVVSGNPQDHRYALNYMKRVLDADTRKSSMLNLGRVGGTARS